MGTMRRSSASYLPRAQLGVHTGLIAVPERPGALVSVSDMRQYIAAVDESAKSLDEDQYGTIVYEDPSELRAAADRASDYGDASGMYAEVKVLEDRAKTRSPKQVRLEEGFGHDWRDVLARWNQKKRDAGYPGDMDASSTGRWYQVRDLHKEINIAHDAYEALGYKASMAKKEEILPSGIPDITGSIGLPSLTTLIPWLVGGALVVGAVVIIPQLRPLLATLRRAVMP